MAKTTKEYHAEISALFQSIPRKKGWAAPEFVVMGKRQYLGRERWVAGYGHGRMYSGRSGLITDRVLGYGESQDDAIAMMRRVIEGTDNG